MAAKVIDVMTTFDVVALLKDFPISKDKDKPTGLPHPGDSPSKYMFMVVTDANKISGQATGNLAFRANPNDFINWRSMALSGNGTQSTVIYKIKKFGNGQDVISMPPVPRVSRPLVPVPDTQDPTKYTLEQSPDYFLNSSVINYGSMNYEVYFYITDLVDNKVVTLGYYYWDPLIQVDRPTA